MTTTTGWRRRVFLVLAVIGLVIVLESTWSSPSSCSNTHPEKSYPKTWNRPKNR